MGVYSSVEFKSKQATEYKVELIDTTYDGAINPMVMKDEGFTRQFDGYQNEIYINPLFCSTLTAYVQVQSTDGPMNAIIDDIANSKEKQFFLAVYKKISSVYQLYWIGMVLTDQCQWADFANFEYQIKATDGLNRLENFEFTYATDPDTPDVIPVGTIIQKALEPCGIEQFFGDDDNYIASLINFNEVNQRTTEGFLCDNRIDKYVLIDDIETNKARTCKDVLELILKPYGASIRMERGLWFITQPHILRSNRIWFTYSKTCDYTAKTDTITDTTFSITASTGGINTPQEQLTHTWKPTYKLVEASYKSASGIEFKPDSTTQIADRLFEKEFTVLDNTDAQDISIDIDVNFFPGIFGKSRKFHLTFEITLGSYSLYAKPVYRYTQLKDSSGNFVKDVKYLAYYEFAWALTSNFKEQPFVVLETVVPENRDPKTVHNLKNTLNIPPLPIPEGTLTVRWYLENLAVYTKWPFLEGANNVLTIHQQITAYNGHDFSYDFDYKAENANAGDLSYSINEDFLLGDGFKNFTPGSIQVYNGTNWQFSQAWHEGTVGAGEPLLQLLAKKAMYFQRTPRDLIDGTFKLLDYDTLILVQFRSKYYLFIAGTFNADSGTWGGRWFEMLEQTTSVTGGSSNPYRKFRAIVDKRFSTVKGILQDHGSKFSTAFDKIADLTDEVIKLKNISQGGVDGFLTNNVNGLSPTAVNGEKFTFKAIANATDKTFDLEFESDGVCPVNDITSSTGGDGNLILTSPGNLWPLGTYQVTRPDASIIALAGFPIHDTQAPQTGVYAILSAKGCTANVVVP